MNKELKMKIRYQNMAKDSNIALDCTCNDEVIRCREIETIDRFIQNSCGTNVLDLGCANGHTINILRSKYPSKDYWGVDITEEMISNANKRSLSNCEFSVGDVRSLEFEDCKFDLIYTQRCLINIPTSDGQEEALREIHRVLKPDGCYLMIECYTDGLDNNNKARIECGLDPLPPAEVNHYFEKDSFLEFIEGKFRIEKLGDFPSNFLSSHYFIARVVHPLITKGDQVKNTEFVKFFSYLPPMGNYSPLQCYVLRKI